MIKVGDIEFGDVSFVSGGPMLVRDGAVAIPLDEQQDADFLDGERHWLVGLIAIRIKRLVRAARRRGERI